MCICHRCSKTSSSSIVSQFNTQEICLDCKNKEEQHPDYEKALQKEVEAIKNGNFNFKGIGRPFDL